mgnify:CR=1 FL=1
MTWYYHGSIDRQDIELRDYFVLVLNCCIVWLCTKTTLKLKKIQCHHYKNEVISLNQGEGKAIASVMAERLTLYYLSIVYTGYSPVLKCRKH